MESIKPFAIINSYWRNYTFFW